MFFCFGVEESAQFQSGFGVCVAEGGSVGKMIEGCSPVKVRRNSTILLVSLSVSATPS